ncbi:MULTISPECIES: LysR family transcriptional regulator [Pseudomonas]|uniref:LysR family transcriptional regulator n=1 Tax=Pseudomonas chlororaphis subsp. aureofaciens TaxID=587851 RepID=A0AAD0ZJH7_9PSED|nr:MULTISPECIES: LysR family transcriptional regulator [Pseudomonas]AZD92948.1 LysR family transcriptional regulator [Pseudomonas chlororaphis subsp. aureofaciens]AZD99395.1 LysR family transcriptional regulator [Pseudomonas chlororaphis subsp. aureofaciens]AZE30254.1 LysR family transcriptional regulator [Pseudomonas chlororaphis subsp. aureofaciens]KAA5842619.1 LysR family transcriptional regulator [Pseudomonas chlororaphis]KAB0532887.1 LysR family transcriptional regulator [Pseudomonas chlo
MTLSQLQIFSLVAELRGFTSAASRLGISQSAVSHALKSLEQELGVELIRRHQSLVELTDIGQQLLLRARAILGLAATMEQEAADARGMKRGTLRIGSFGPTSSMKLLPAILRSYREAHPGIEVHIDEGPDRQVLQWLEERRIDVGFVVLPQERFDCFALVEDQMVALIPSQHGLAAKDSVSLAELCDDPFILTEAGSAELVSRLFLAARLSPNIRYRSSQLLSTLETVARGDALTLVAQLSLPEANDPRYRIKALSPPARRQVGLAVLDRRQASPATLAFIEQARSLYRRD